MADGGEWKHTCKECGKSYSKKWRLDEHRRSHTGERPYKCTFEGCDKAFIRPFHLKRHLLSHTGQPASFNCSYPGCTQTYSLKHNLKRHEQRSHNHPFKCQFEGCSQTFKKSSQLRRHTCLHTNESLYKCQVEGCGRGFNTSSRLLRHMKVHNKGYICSIPGCSEAFNKFSQLAVHVRSHGFVCEKCKKTFSEVWELKKHVQIHSTNRKLFECPREGCNRVYTKAFNLKVHIKAFHDGNRPYICTVEGCGKGFAHKVSLRQHLVLHSEGKIKQKRPPREEKRTKKKRKPASLAKKLSGYRSSFSESSDTHGENKAKRRRRMKMATAGSAQEGEEGQSNDYSSTNTEEIAKSVNVMSSNERFPTTEADLTRSDGTVVGFTPPVLLNAEVSNDGPSMSSLVLRGSRETQGSFSVQSTDTNLERCSTSICESNTCRNLSEELAVSARVNCANVTFSSNDSVVTAANMSTSESIVSHPLPLGNISSECWNSSTVVTNTSASPSASASRDKNATSTAVGDLMHSSSHEEEENMDWEAVNDACDSESRHDSEVSEHTQSDSRNEVCSNDEHLAAARVDNSPVLASEGLLCEVFNAVNSMESTEAMDLSQRNNFPSSLARAASKDTEGNGEGNQLNDKKKRRGPKKSRECCVEDSGSKPAESVFIKRPDLPVSRGEEGDMFMGADEFPGMDDVLQVIIEEEEEELARSQCETRLVIEDLKLGKRCVRGSSSVLVEASCETADEGADHVVITEEHVTSATGKGISVEETPKGSDRFTPVCSALHVSTGEAGSVVEVNVVEDQSFESVSNDHEVVSTYKEVINVTEETNPACDLYISTGEVGGVVEECTSRELARAQDSGKTKISRCEANVSANGERESRPQQGTHRESNDKNDNNVGTEPPLNKRMPVKAAVPNTTKALKKSTKLTNRTADHCTSSEGRRDLGLETEKKSPSSVKLKRNMEPGEASEDISKAKFRNRSNIFSCDLQTLELLWNFKGK